MEDGVILGKSPRASRSELVRASVPGVDRPPTWRSRSARKPSSILVDLVGPYPASPREGAACHRGM